MGLNDEVLRLHDLNWLTVTRQVLCHPGRHDTVDMVFAVNGLPVAKCELKNPGTGQNWHHAVKQYQQDRNPRALKAILGATANETEEGEIDWEDRLNQIMQSRGRQPNLSFFAFTATPKGKTLELFGRTGASGLPEAFHIYSMRQAIEEKACKDSQVIQTALANPLDKFELGIRKLIEDLMIERMAENDQIVTRYMADLEFQGSAFLILAKEIFGAIRSRQEVGSSKASLGQ